MFMCLLEREKITACVAYADLYTITCGEWGLSPVPFLISIFYFLVSPASPSAKLRRRFFQLVEPGIFLLFLFFRG